MGHLLSCRSDTPAARSAKPEMPFLRASWSADDFGPGMEKVWQFFSLRKPGKRFSRETSLLGESIKCGPGKKGHFTISADYASAAGKYGSFKLSNVPAPFPAEELFHRNMLIRFPPNLFPAGLDS